jgi:hypothetical protein
MSVFMRLTRTLGCSFVAAMALGACNGEISGSGVPGGGMSGPGATAPGATGAGGTTAGPAPTGPERR